ncbi:flagellar motor protein MotB [Rhizorhabdus wittichii DC-6]|jgi:outer membrane protein OmpA-like peptidoglycan-associated protein|uniref:OmpA/MotB domain protein n=1 Tax=Rhizorhabdus wittichii (strain DSM 6014 / CCUG 31198 / JCM 15750 / NBRC 105917 / EY 4224 / RW1) TaxID=392499 RepID=A0A9J9HA47_RHIWR|nr:OmpA family protein [Rhizorhabdus wittichii]ABQ67599.1 OmpA/MotB domain protein [Rhizorhabdus wittichii RW1]ARR55634.1 flagellar motor protein MotB [Rhizorhabdus wittichii DC-6]
MNRVLPLLAVAGLLAGCATTPTLTLLPTEEGKQGAVAVLEENGKPMETVVSELNSSTNLSGTPRTRSIDPAKMSARQRELLQALPPAPVRLTLYFLEGTTELTPESQPGLAFLIKEVSERPGAEVQVTGYTDTLGEADANDRLSQQRAEEVLGVLAKQGIDPTLMSAVGRGERNLRVATPDGVSEPANRRVVVTIR